MTLKWIMSTTLSCLIHFSSLLRKNKDGPPSYRNLEGSAQSAYTTSQYSLIKAVEFGCCKIFSLELFWHRPLGIIEGGLMEPF